MNRSRILVLLVVAIAVPAAAQPPAPGRATRRIVSCRREAALEECLAVVQGIGGSVTRVLPLIHAFVIEIPAERVVAAQARLTSATRVERCDADKRFRALRDDPGDLAAPGLDEVARRMRGLKSLQAA